MVSETNTIRAGWLIDGSGNKAVKDCLIILAGERIAAVTEITHSPEIPSEYMDFSDSTIVPGLIDSHTHLTMSGIPDPRIRNVQITDAYHCAETRIKKHISDYLKYGVVAVRDGGDFHAHALRYKNNLQSKKDIPVTIYAAGNGWHKKGRYGQLLGMYLEPGRDLAQAVHEDLKPGTDHIKIVNSGLNSLTEFGRETSPQFTKEELSRTVAAAGCMGLRVMVHANGNIPVRIAIESGCHTIEHGFFMGDDNLKRMADNKIVWVPTACTMKAYMEASEAQTRGRLVSEKNMIHQFEQIRKAMEYGVTIALGTDAGCPGVYHGSSVIDEFKILIEAGFSVEQAVKSATSNAKKVIDDDANYGTISEGMPATFVALKGKPHNFPGSLAEIRGIWIDGKQI